MTLNYRYAPAYTRLREIVRDGVLLSYCLIAYSLWEGLHVAITGTKGRVEMAICENINHLQGDRWCRRDSGGYFQQYCDANRTDGDGIRFIPTA